MTEFRSDNLVALAASRGLIYPRNVLAELTAAMLSGRHVMLTGPPGTGKTSLAYLAADLGREAMLCTGYLAVTASTEWTVRETIGGYTDTPEGPVFQPGVFLQAMQSGQWLVIDELNRADFDRAFGPLFTVLANQSVILPYKQPGHSDPLAIVPAGAAIPPHTDVITMSKQWRMVATMNEFDKETLHRLSYALMRRFAFIEVGTPPDDIVRSLVAGPGELVADLLPVRQFVDLGPALFIDAARFAAYRIGDTATTRSRVLYESFYAFILPQLDRLDDRQAHALFETLAPFFDGVEVRELGRAIRKVIGRSTLAAAEVREMAAQARGTGA